MKINKDTNINDIKKQTEKGKLYCFGAGAMGVDFCEFAINSGINIENIIFVDNFATYESKNNIPVISKAKMIESITDKDFIVIATVFSGEIYEDLNTYDILNNVSVGFSPIIYRNEWTPLEKLALTHKSDIEIPKVIHYCWFGKGEIPDFFEKYLQTWKEKLPDYTIKRWDESNYDVNKVEYTKEAYKNRKFGLVCDYARIDIVYEYGGIYLDIDVEVLKNFDSLLNQNMFATFCSSGKINFGSGFGAVPNHPILKIMRDEYIENIDLLTFNTEYQHQSLLKYNSNYKNNWRLQEFDDFVLLPIDIACGCDHYLDEYVKTENTIVVHHCKATWYNKEKKESALKSIELLQSIRKGT